MISLMLYYVIKGLLIMARALIDIPNDKLKKLGEIAVMHHVSRAAVLRMAVDDFIEKVNKSASQDVFGILKDEKIDSIELQQTLREEW